MILVTGASGTVGKYVAQEVSRTRCEYRLMYRSAADAAAAGDSAKAVVADFADNASLRKALEGVDSVYLVCSPIPQLVELETNTIDACKKTGVRHVVLNSALGAADYPKSFPGWHRKVEDKLKASGLTHTILRPNSFHQNVTTYFAPTVRAQGAFYAAVGNSRTSFLDVRDIAVVAAQALTDTKHAGRTYELNGPEGLSYTQVAEKISKHAGRPAKYVDLPMDVIRKAMLDQGMPEWQVTALLELQEYYVSGRGGATDGLLRTLLQRDPITMDQFLNEYKDEFREQAAGA